MRLRTRPATLSLALAAGDRAKVEVALGVRVATSMLAASALLVALYQPFRLRLANQMELTAQALLLLCLLVAFTYFSGLQEAWAEVPRLPRLEAPGPATLDKA